MTKQNSSKKVTLENLVVALAEAAPVVEAPVVEAPVVEAPVVEAPVVEAPVVEAPPVKKFVLIEDCDQAWYGGEINVGLGEIISGYAIGLKNGLYHWYRLVDGAYTVYTNGLGRQGFTADMATPAIKCKQWEARGGLNRYTYNKLKSASA